MCNKEKIEQTSRNKIKGEILVQLCLKTMNPFLMRECVPSVEVADSGTGDWKWLWWSFIVVLTVVIVMLA